MKIRALSTLLAVSLLLNCAIAIWCALNQRDAAKREQWLSMTTESLNETLSESYDEIESLHKTLNKERGNVCGVIKKEEQSFQLTSNFSVPLGVISAVVIDERGEPTRPTQLPDSLIPGKSVQIPVKYAHAAYNSKFLLFAEANGEKIVLYNSTYLFSGRDEELYWKKCDGLMRYVLRSIEQ